MNTYQAFYANKQITVTANDLFGAVIYARENLRVPKSKQGLLSVMLVAKGNQQVVHSTAYI